MGEGTLHEESGRNIEWEKLRKHSEGRTGNVE